MASYHKTFMLQTVLISILLFHLSLGQQCEVISGAGAKTFLDITTTPARTPAIFTNCKRETDFSSSPRATPKTGYRSNGLGNFCIVLTDVDSPADPAADYGGPHDDNHYKILKQLAMTGAWSNQPTDNLPSSLGDEENKYASFAYPEQGAHNPYYIEVTGISVKGDLLHNWLHFRVFMNRSESLGFDDTGSNREAPQSDRDKVLNGDGTFRTPEHPDNARGTISALLMMVKDQDGWPIGDFSQDIPCYRTCSQYPSETYYGDKTNALPCAFTPPRATSHPGMFVYDVHPGFYLEDELTTERPGKVTTTESTEPTTEEILVSTDPPETTTTSTTPAPAPGPSQSPKPTKMTVPPLEFPVPEKSRRKGVREVHATWTFNQNSCNFVSKIYIETLVLEDVRHAVKADPRPPPPPATPSPPSAGNQNPKLFGWTAQYNILLPTKSSLGAADYVDLKYLKERDLRVADVDCHVPMFDAPKTFFNGFLKGQVPQHTPDNQVSVPTVQQYMFGLFGAMGLKEYYGQHGIDGTCNGQGDKIPGDDPDSKRREVLPTVQEFILDGKNPGIRCPCPALPSTQPPENVTLDPTRQHGRLLHASHMAIAYMLLTPLACFVARYYKETFITVFCFQEYWWYMWHVVLLIVACVFNFGAVLSIARNKLRSDTIKRDLNDNLLVHVVLGAMSIFVFYMEIFTGFFRVADPQKRLRQIFMHWLIGVMNNVCAVGSMFAMAWVNDSGMSCNTIYTIILWLLFVITCYVIMELDMRKTDKKLKLVPKRSYLPPPVVRLFNRDAPGRDFRMMMLGIFIIGLLALQLLVSYYIWHSGGESCEQEWISYYMSAAEITDEGDYDGGEEGGGDDPDDDGDE